jgi:hypothetical protein
MCSGMSWILYLLRNGVAHVVAHQIQVRFAWDTQLVTGDDDALKGRSEV